VIQAWFAVSSIGFRSWTLSWIGRTARTGTSRRYSSLELKIAFNEAGYVFRTEEDRYRGLELPGNRVVECVALGSVELEDEDVKVLKEYLSIKESVDKLVEKYFGKRAR
jgi:hypothetical protein